MSQRTSEFYEYLLTPFINSYELTPEDINEFLTTLRCANSNNAYYRAIRAFCNWLSRQKIINPLYRSKRWP